jgi:polyhydroxyalkanoate synthesis regulator phasin
LAATIGLEEACMLSLLSDVALYGNLGWAEGRQWLDLDAQAVARLMPFWSDYDVQRISKNLVDKGIILLASAPFLSSRRLQLAFNTGVAPEPLSPSATHPASVSPAPSHAAGPNANRIAPNWQPDPELIKRIQEHNIPDYFIRQQLPEFVTYWRERGEISHAWGAKFLKQLLHQWRDTQTQIARQSRDSESDFIRSDQEIAMHSQWRPSRDALEVLVKHASVNLAFVEDSIPEFVVYWQERGDVGRTWNSKFIQHVKRQWVRFNSALEHDTEPRRIPENWQPSKDVYDVLKLANIDMNFAQRQVAEFLLFWRDSNQVYASWNTKFLQHVKYHWAKQHALTTHNSSQVNSHAGQPTAHSTASTRDRSLREDLSDRSWAS